MYQAGTLPGASPTTVSSDLRQLAALPAPDGAAGGDAGPEPKASPSSHNGAALAASKLTARELEQRKRSRDFLSQCLQEINFLTYAKAIHPVSDRALESSAGSESGDVSTGGPFRLTRSVEVSSVATSPPSLSNHAISDDHARNELQSYRPSPLGPSGTANTSTSLVAHPSEPVEDSDDSHSSNSWGSSSGAQSDPSSATSAPPLEQQGCSLQEREAPKQRARFEDEPDTDHPVTAIFRGSDMQKLKVLGLASLAPKSHPEEAGASEDELAGLTLPETKLEPTSPAAILAQAASQHWQPVNVLRHHLDAVRSISFDESRLVLVSGSDDCTVKFWNLDPSRPPSSSGPVDLAKPLSSAHKYSNDLAPVTTYRGHTAGVTSVLVSTLQGKVYSASFDSTIRVWHVPDDERVLYAPFNPNFEAGILVGHTDAIWDLSFLPAASCAASASAAPVSNDTMRATENGYLASVSADGTTKVWDLLADKHPALKASWTYFGSFEREQDISEPLPVPTTVAPYPSDWRHCVVGYNNNVVKLFELQTGRPVREFITRDPEGAGAQTHTQINKVVVHPTLPLLITAHQDGFMCFVQTETGETRSMQGHNSPISSLDIDPAGLTLVSGGEDCSVRFWDLAPRNDAVTEDPPSPTSSSEVVGGLAAGKEKSDAPIRLGKDTICVQEISAHKQKAQEGVLAVAYHRSAPHFASSGADGLIRTYH